MKMKLRLESLDERINPGVVSAEPVTCTWIYTGSGYGDSMDEDNWEGAIIPGYDDNVVIPYGTGNIDLKQTHLRSLQIEPSWSGTVDVDGEGTLTIGGGSDSPDATSYLTSEIKLHQSLAFSYGEVTCNYALFTTPTGGTHRAVVFSGATTAHFVDSVHFDGYLTNNGVLTVDGDVHIDWSGSYISNFGDLDLYTGTWHTRVDDPTYNILYSNGANSRIQKFGTGTYTLGSYVSSLGELDVYAGKLSLQGEATAADSSVYSIHQFGNTYLYGGSYTELNASHTIWVDEALLEMKPGESGTGMYNASITGADVKIQDGFLALGDGTGGGYFVLTASGKVWLLGTSTFTAEYDWSTGYATKLACNSIFVDDNVTFGIIQANVPEVKSAWGPLTVVDTNNSALGDGPGTYLVGGLSQEWTGAGDWVVSYVP